MPRTMPLGRGRCARALLCVFLRSSRLAIRRLALVALDVGDRRAARVEVARLHVEIVRGRPDEEGARAPGPLRTASAIRKLDVVQADPSSHPSRVRRGARRPASCGRPSAPGTRRRRPSSSSIRSSWLYFATRSERDGAPVLIWPQPGGDREVGDRRVLGLARAVRHDRGVARARAPCAIASSVSVSVPIWLTLMRIELPTPASIPRCRRSVFVTNRSSPTSWHALAQPLGQAPSSRPSPPRPSRPRSRRSGSGRTARPSRRPARRPRASRPSCSRS